MAPGPSAAKIVVKAEDAVHLGMRKVERAGDQGNRRLVHIPELVLQGMENREQGAGQAL
jgi:hypothetical protein